jgi:hypothetical protein
MPCLSKGKKMTDIYVIRSTYERNASDGIEYFTDKNELAEAVHEAEKSGARVQVYKCVPVKHDVYLSKIDIVLYD